MQFGEVLSETSYTPRASRMAYDLLVRYRQGSKRANLILKNLTHVGARLEGLSGLQLGDAAMIQLPGLAPKAAKIVWLRGLDAGLEFEYALHPDIYDRMVHDFAEMRPRTVADLEPTPEERPQQAPRAA
ncbi:MAG: hypothetical protein RLY97_72 [Pseudomonadota bacterium]|jgi:hypothetical protein